MERSGTEGSPVAKKKSSEKDWVRGKGDSSAPLGMTRLAGQNDQPGGCCLT
ncbi:hypothetical protein [Ravibacter arvi]|uniref:hypothetical protein n=1 Tax=Ravibacter arvi TaxID=2051041 RepID=UPI0031EC9417